MGLDDGVLDSAPVQISAQGAPHALSSRDESKSQAAVRRVDLTYCSGSPRSGMGRPPRGGGILRSLLEALEQRRENAITITALRWIDGTLATLVAAFEQHCESNTAALRGCVKYDAFMSDAGAGLLDASVVGDAGNDADASR